MKRLGVVTFVALLLGAPFAGAQTSARHPDVLLLLVDGLGTAPFPSLEALARRGRSFERAYLIDPRASLSRASVFLGRRPERVSVWAELAQKPEGTTLLTEAFAQAGYALVRVGGATGGALDAKLPWEKTLVPGKGADTSQHIVALLEAPSAKPRLIVAGFDDLGAPLVLPKDGVGISGGPERPSIAQGDLDFLDRPGRRRPALAATEEARKLASAAQQERTRRFDEQLGHIVAALEQGGRWPGTIVALASMQAPVLGEHGLRADALFEDSLRVPLVVAAPSVAAPGPTTALADTTDLFPTLLELAGLPPVAGLDGQSQIAAIREAKAPGRPAVASIVRREAGRLGRSVRTARFRFSEWPDGSLELYDHDTDPREHTNLAGRKEHAATLAEMKTRLDARERELTARAPEPPPPAPAAAGRRPNVLFILADDMAMPLGTYGFPVKTPNIDRLAAVGRRFDRAYAQFAMCNPSRSSLLSGWRPERVGVWENVHSPRARDMVPLQEHFGANGYWTASIGKVWEPAFANDFRWDLLEYDPALEGADEPPAGQVTKKGGPGGPAWWGHIDSPDEETPDGRRARRVAALVSQKRDRPFFIALGFAKPHLKWIVPSRYFDLYDPAKIEPPAPPADLAGVPAIAIKRELTRPGASLAGQEPPGMLPDPQLRKEAIAAYYAAVSFVDAQVGVVLAALDREKLWDSTIVVLTSDHGYHLGDHRGLWRKETLFEEALRVPLLIAAPGAGPPGAGASAPAELLDLYPTLVELAALPKVPGLNGTSLVPMLVDPKASVRTSAFSVRQVRASPIAASVRTARWRYTQWPDGSEELFDAERDPQQRENLVSRPEHAAALADLRARRIEIVP